jgi:hypothetical protein
VIYLYGYLAIGAVVLAILFVLPGRTQDDESKSLRDLLNTMRANRRKRSYRILHRLVIPVLASVAVVFIWPVTVYMRVTRAFSNKDTAPCRA